MKTPARSTHSAAAGATAPAAARIPAVWIVTAAVLWAVYLLGTLAPRGFTWGIHFAAYLPGWARVAVAALSAAVIVAGLARLPFDRWCGALERWASNRRTAGAGYAAIALIVLVAGVIFRDRVFVFGDSQNILKWFGDNRTISTAWVRPLFTLDFSASRETLVVAIHRFLAHVTGSPIATTYAVVSSAAGGAALAAWLWICRSDPRLRPWVLPLVATALFMTGNAVFLGHVENYALPTAVAIFCLAFSERSARLGTSALPAVLLFLLAARMYVVYITLFPVVYVAVIAAIARRNPSRAGLLSSRALALACLAAPIALGGILYFIVFRAATWRPEAGVPLFLPLAGMNPPFKSYTLLSPAHFLDFLNALAHVIFPAAPILLTAFLLTRKEKPWRDPLWLATASSVCLVMIFCFAAHAAMSMPRDWDLFSVLMPGVLFLAALTLRARLPPAGHRAGVLLVALAVMPFALSGYVVNWTPQLLARRWADVAVHVFDTYYGGASYILNDAARIGTDRLATAALIESAGDRMKPWASIPDPEYSHAMYVLCQVETENGRTGKVVDYLRRSLTASPEDVPTLMRAVSLYASLGMIPEARAAVATLLRLTPDNPEVWRAHVLLDCKTGPELCAAAVDAALARFPGNPEFLKLKEEVAGGANRAVNGAGTAH